VLERDRVRCRPPDGVLGTRTKVALERFGISRGVQVEPPKYLRVRLAVIEECLKVLETIQRDRQPMNEPWRLGVASQDLAEGSYAILRKAYEIGRISHAVLAEAQQRYTAWQQAHRDYIALLQLGTGSKDQIGQSAKTMGELSIRLGELIMANGLDQ
jgi:hypothetical protein